MANGFSTPRQTNYSKYIGMMTEEGSTKIVNFMTPGVRGSCARARPYKTYGENVLFLIKS